MNKKIVFSLFFIIFSSYGVTTTEFDLHDQIDRTIRKNYNIDLLKEKKNLDYFIMIIQEIKKNPTKFYESEWKSDSELLQNLISIINKNIYWGIHNCLNELGEQIEWVLLSMKKVPIQKALVQLFPQKNNEERLELFQKTIFEACNAIEDRFIELDTDVKTAGFVPIIPSDLNIPSFTQLLKSMLS